MRKIVIISDNSKDILLLQDYLGATPGVSLAGIFSTLAEATPTLNKAKSDILFAAAAILANIPKDIVLPPICVCLGIEAEMLSHPPQKNLFAFLHTPFSYERVFSLLQNIESYMLQSSDHHTGVKREYIFIKSEYKLIKINLADILFLSGLRDYTQVFLKGKVSPLTTLQNLKDFESKLPGHSFIRVHRSYIVSLGQVDSISRNEITIGTYTIPIGHAYRQLLDDMISKNS